MWLIRCIFQHDHFLLSCRRYIELIQYSFPIGVQSTGSTCVFDLRECKKSEMHSDCAGRLKRKAIVNLGQWMITEDSETRIWTEWKLDSFEVNFILKDDKIVRIKNLYEENFAWLNIDKNVFVSCTIFFAGKI